MVAISFSELIALLAPCFEVHVFEHDYEKYDALGTPPLGMQFSSA